METRLFAIHKPKEVRETWVKKKCSSICTINRIVDSLRVKPVKLKIQILIKVKLQDNFKNYFRKTKMIIEQILDLL